MLQIPAKIIELATNISKRKENTTYQHQLKIAYFLSSYEKFVAFKKVKNSKIQLKDRNARTYDLRVR